MCVEMQSMIFLKQIHQYDKMISVEWNLHVFERNANFFLRMLSEEQVRVHKIKTEEYRMTMSNC